MQIHELISLGLSRPEAKIYKACLDLGCDTVTSIARKANVNRKSAYEVLNALMKKGFVKEIQHPNKPKKFVSENPFSIQKIFDTKLKKSQEYHNSVQDTIHQISSIFYGRVGFKVTKIEGKDASDLVTRTLLESDEKIRIFENYDELTELVPLKENDIRLNFKNHRRPIIVIASSNKKQGIKKNGSVTYYFVSPQSFTIKGETIIFGNTIVVTHAGEPYAGVILEDIEMAETHKTLFDLSLEAIKSKIST